MVIEEIKNIQSGKKQLRQFAIAMGIISAVLGWLFLVQHQGYWLYFFIFSAAFFVLGLNFPVALKPVQKVWMSLAIMISWIITRIILILLFYLVVTPIGILAKICGKRFLDTAFDKNEESYWMVRKSTSFEPQSYEKQF